MLTKAKWVLIGSIVPELVVFVAWSQKQEAKRISATLTKVFRERVRNSNGNNQYTSF